MLAWRELTTFSISAIVTVLYVAMMQSYVLHCTSNCNMCGPFHLEMSQNVLIGWVIDHTTSL